MGRKRECERLEKCIKVTGAYGQPKEVQLRNFADELNRRSEKEWANPKDWIQAFNYLRNYIEELSDNEKHVFFIDEMPWLDTHKSGFLPAFEYFWNDYGSQEVMKN